jgi:four helix bundle protein
MAFKFEKLNVWKESVELTGYIHTILTAQIKRAADSISLNIAEGSTGQSDAEFKKFLGYSVRSGIEVVGCIYIAKRRNIISDEDFTYVYNEVDRLIKRIQALRKSIT